MGLVSNDEYLSIGLALASAPFDYFIQFDKNRMGSFVASDKLRAKDPDFTTRYKKTAICAKNYSLAESTTMQGFWLLLKPSVNQMQLLVPNYEPVLLNLPVSWRGQALQAYVGTRNRSSALLASMDQLTFNRCFGKDEIP